MTIRIWDVPSDPPPGHELKDPVAILSGSAKKVIATEWNPVADFILASGCFDGTVALWYATVGAWFQCTFVRMERGCYRPSGGLV